ncbi:secondary thiamine-phosphate synthase enzyme YjbQ [Acidobacteria bacterium AH-259-D05]|nr:secondary thiamine-phosphate synthase enzyme YjbQ [Acidobacteria bacterium AH-259-D05]
MIIKDFTLSLDTQGFCHVVNITDEVQDRVHESTIKSGSVTVFVVGSTAGVTVVEYEPGLVKDLEELFDKLAPPTRDYHHEQAWHDGNGFSHVRASLLKPSLVVPVVSGKMRLGTWQQIVVLDFDNHPRTREVAVQVMGL